MQYQTQLYKHQRTETENIMPTKFKKTGLLHLVFLMIKVDSTLLFFQVKTSL